MECPEKTSGEGLNGTETLKKNPDGTFMDGSNPANWDVSGPAPRNLPYPSPTQGNTIPGKPVNQFPMYKGNVKQVEWK